MEARHWSVRVVVPVTVTDSSEVADERMEWSEVTPVTGCLTLVGSLMFTGGREDGGWSSRLM